VHDELAQYVVMRAFEMLKRKGYTSQGIAVAAACVVRCVRRDQKQVLVLSNRPHPDYGVGDVVLSVPCVVGRSGIERQLILSLTAEEKECLRNSAAILEQAYQSVTK
jgi:L-lactate dehydrogenase